MKNDYDFSLKKVFSVAFAYVGVLTGAGLATGREMLQYFVSFGKIGLAGLIVITLLHMLYAKWILTLGAYYETTHHMDALEAIAPPLLAKLLDWSLVVACFIMSFVLIAGAGANLEQQTGIPAWIGSLACALGILGVSYLNFARVTAALGMFTPVILALLLIGIGYILLGPAIDWQAQFNYAAQAPTPLPNITISTLNYFALCLMSSTSMLFVLGGKVKNIAVAEKGGLLGGFLTGIVSILGSLILYSKIDVIATAEVPMLSFMTTIHPLIGVVMFVIIMGMIFNSGISVTYSMAKRGARNSRRLFHWIIFFIVGISFALSFVGFSDLVALLYPVLGYVGLLLLVTIAIAGIGQRKKIYLAKKEQYDKVINI